MCISKFIQYKHRKYTSYRDNISSSTIYRLFSSLQKSFIKLELKSPGLRAFDVELSDRSTSKSQSVQHGNLRAFDVEISERSTSKSQSVERFLKALLSNLRQRLLSNL